MPTLQDVLHQHLSRYTETHRLSIAQRRTVYALSACRTAQLGGHVQRCPNGHVERAWYNSCHHRACPQCNSLARERWLDKMRARLIDCAHHHLIFTIPHDLNGLWMLNTPTMIQALFAAVRATLAELLSDPRYLGAQFGAMLALHTWSRALALHPHIHALVTDGGLSDDGLWVRPRRSHFLPARVVMMLFRGKLLGALRALHDAGELCRPDDLSEAHFHRLLNRLGRVKWNVRIGERYDHGRGVGIYLARYVRGGALHNGQITHASDSAVVFRYTPHRAEHAQSMRLDPSSFLQRVLHHAPEPNLHTVRYLGLYTPRHTEALNRARGLHDQRAYEAPEPISCDRFLLAFPTVRHMLHCPQCGARLVNVRSIAQSRAPP